MSGTIANLGIRVFVDNKAAVVGLGKTADKLKGLGGLSAKIGLGLGRLGSALGSVGAVAGPAAAIIGATTAAVAGATYAFWRLLEPSFAIIDAQRDVALKLGVSQAAVQKLALAAEFSGVALDDLVKAMLMMTKKGGVGSIEQNFFKLVKSISAIEDPSKRAQEAFKHFGKSAAAILPLFAEPENLLEAVEAIERFGLAISDIDAKKIDDAKDKLHLLGTVVRGTLNKVAIEIAPVITAMVDKLLDKFEEWGKGISSLGITWDTVGDVFVAVGAVIYSVLDTVDAEIRRTYANLRLMKNALEAILAIERGDVADAMKNSVEGVMALQDAGRATEDLLNVLTGQSARQFIDAATKLRTATHTKGRGADAVGGLGTSSSSKAVEKGSHEAWKITRDNGMDAIERELSKANENLTEIRNNTGRRSTGATLKVAAV